jgi:GNAT superfamily N-acetyltransferase
MTYDAAIENDTETLPDIKTRLAEMKDFEVCLAFDCTDPTDSRGDQEKSDLIRARIETGEIFLAVTEKDNPVGYLAINRLWPMMMPLLSWLYVAPAWRDRGVGRQLIEFCLVNLKERGYKRLMVSTQTDRVRMLETIRKMKLREIGTLQANPDDSVGEVFFIKDL